MEEVVARKLKQFGKSRRELIHALADHFKVKVSTDVERFFEAAERGRWEEIDAAHEVLLSPGGGFNQPRSAELSQICPICVSEKIIENEPTEQAPSLSNSATAIL